MPIPSNFEYRAGAYWNRLTGQGPFGFAVGSSTPVPLRTVGTQPPANIRLLNGRNYFNLAGEGPFARS